MTFFSRCFGFVSLVCLQFYTAGCGLQPESTALVLSPESLSSVELNSRNVRRTVMLAHGLRHNDAESCRETDDPYEFGARVFAVSYPNVSNACTSSAAVFFGAPNGLNGGCPTDLGSCVDMSHYRTSIEMTESERLLFKLHATQNSVFAANVRDANGFHIAEIPLDGIQEMVFQVTTRPLPLLGRQGGHSQMRVIFKPGYKVKLRTQWPFDGTVVREVSDLILVANAQGKKGSSYGILSTAPDGSFILPMMVQTLDYSVWDHYRVDSAMSVEQYKLDLSPAEKRKYVEYWLKAAGHYNESRQYSILNANCNTEQLRVLDRAQGRQSDVATKHIPAWWDKTVNPNLVTYALKDRNLIKSREENHFGLLEQEPAVQAVLKHFGLSIFAK